MASNQKVLEWNWFGIRVQRVQINKKSKVWRKLAHFDFFVNIFPRPWTLDFTRKSEKFSFQRNLCGLSIWTRWFRICSPFSNIPFSLYPRSGQSLFDHESYSYGRLACTKSCNFWKNIDIDKPFSTSKELFCDLPSLHTSFLWFFKVK